MTGVNECSKRNCASEVHFQWHETERQINVIISYGMNLWKSLGLNGHHEFQTGDIYVRQSKPEQWLRLISILMNANWHICYGGLAVQTLQLAWLINYPHAGGSLEMEAGERAGRGLKREMKEHWRKKWKKTVQNLHSLNQSIFFLFFISLD